MCVKWSHKELFHVYTWACKQAHLGNLRATEGESWAQILLIAELMKPTLRRDAKAATRTSHWAQRWAPVRKFLDNWEKCVH